MQFARGFPGITLGKFARSISSWHYSLANRNISCSEWYIDTNPTPQNSRPKIQRVPQNLRNRKKFEEHYTPKLVSIGPIHHGNTDLKLGEKYKLRWAAEYIKNTGSIQKNLHKKIVDNIDKLKSHFDEDVLTLTGDSLKGFGSLEEKLSWMLFVDGCSLLHILEKARLSEPEVMNVKADQLVLVIMDVLLLENQLSYEVLKLLWKDDDESELIMTMINFLKGQHWPKPDMVPDRKGKEQHSVSITNESETPTHLLDLQRNIILSAPNSKTRGYEASKEKWYKKSSKEKITMMTYRSIKDLRKVGVTLKSSKTRRVSDVDFSEGWLVAKLILPEIIVDDTSAATYLNLIAYEMCPDFDNDYSICSYAAFMDSLIDHPEDVKLLRSKGILVNSLGSDEEIADLFKIIGTDLIPNTETYSEVRAKIHQHHCNGWKLWITLGYYTYFSIAAFIALALTFIQTVFTIYTACKKDD